MKRCGQGSNGQVMNVIRKMAFAALFALVTLLQMGGSLHTGILLKVLTSGDTSDAGASWCGQGGDAAGTSWMGDQDGLQCDALLPVRRVGLIVALVTLRFNRVPEAAWSRYHDNMRPPLQRAMAVFCNFSLLRSILHPHLFLLAHASSVLC